MNNFSEPKIEKISFDASEIITASNNCNQGMQNTAWNCGGNQNVTCPEAGSKEIQG